MEDGILQYQHFQTTKNIGIQWFRDQNSLLLQVESNESREEVMYFGIILFLLLLLWLLLVRVVAFVVGLAVVVVTVGHRNLNLKFGQNRANDK